MAREADQAPSSIHSTTGQILDANETILGTGELTEGSVVLFTTTATDITALEEVTVDGNVYLVVNGTADDGIYVWNSSPTTTGLPVQVNYEGAGSADANAALLVGTESA